MEVNGQLHGPGKDIGTHWIEGWVGSKADLHALEER
jgi:hypothetical protein